VKAVQGLLVGEKEDQERRGKGRGKEGEGRRKGGGREEERRGKGGGKECAAPRSVWRPGAGGDLNR